MNLVPASHGGRVVRCAVVTMALQLLRTFLTTTNDNLVRGQSRMVRVLVGWLVNTEGGWDREQTRKG